MWGRVHLDSINELRRVSCETRWICTRTPSNLNALQEEYSIPNATTNYREMLEDPELDGVIVSTPPFLHADHGIAVLEAGKHLLLEKPMATTREDADRLVAAARAHPGQVSLEASCRFTQLNPKFTFVKEILDSGRLGNVYLVHHHEMKPTTFVQYNPRATDWATDPKRAGGGPIIDWGPYDFAFHFGILGNPTPHKRVAATALTQGGVERHAVALVEFPGNVTYQLERAGGTPFAAKSTTRIHGTKGSLSFGYQPWEPKEIELTEFEIDIEELARRTEPVTEGQELKRTTLTCDYDRPWHENTYLTEHFVHCIRGSTEPMMSFDLARRNLEVSFSILDELGQR